MEWMIWVCFICIILYSSYPDKIRRLENKVKKLERKECMMSNIITSLIGKECKLRTEEGLFFSGNVEVNCSVLDADDEWIKISYVDKKNINKIRILRIDSITNIEVIED